MTNEFINLSMGRLEDITDQMVYHQNQGNHDLVLLLDKEARELSAQLDSGEFLTLPQI